MGVFCAEYTRHKSEFLQAQDKASKDARTELTKFIKARGDIIDAIKAGVSGTLLKDDLEQLTAR